MEKIKYSDFVRQISKECGYAQKDISEVLTVASKCIADNLNNQQSTTIMKGVIVYPGVYPATDKRDDNGNIIHRDEVIYPRARFGSAFKKQMLFS